jgi:hypothetical protein
MMPARCARCGQEFAEGLSACPRCGWAPGEPGPAEPAPAAPVPAAPAPVVPAPATPLPAAPAPVVPAPATPVTPRPAAGAPAGTFFRPPAPLAAKPEVVAAPPPLEPELPPRRHFTGWDGLVVLGGALALAVAWYASPMLFHRRPAPAPPPKQAAPPPAAAPKHQVSSEEREAATVAIGSLKTLLDATAAGVKYEQYEAFALDAKRQVEPYLLIQTSDAEIRRNVQEALDLFLLALSTWTLVRQKEWKALIADPRIELCGPVRAAREGIFTSGDVSREQVQALAVARAIPQLWECAAGRIATAEQTLQAK